jgi:hypothetical protein
MRALLAAPARAGTLAGMGISPPDDETRRAAAGDARRRALRDFLAGTVVRYA